MECSSKVMNTTNDGTSTNSISKPQDNYTTVRPSAQAEHV